MIRPAGHRSWPNHRDGRGTGIPHPSLSIASGRATRPKDRPFWQSPAEGQTIKETRPLRTLNRDAEALGRRISFRVVDVGGAATGGTESGLARANEQIDDDDQKIPGWLPNKLLRPDASSVIAK